MGGWKNIIALGSLVATQVVAWPASAQSTWSLQVAKLIQANFSYPRSAEMRREQGRTILHVAVASDGRISGSEVKQSSGSPILDREAIRIVDKIGRFPSPPKGLTAIDLPITWRLD